MTDIKHKATAVDQGVVLNVNYRAPWNGSGQRFKENSGRQQVVPGVGQMSTLV